MRLFLDVCALNRPHDDQQQTRIFIETQAVHSVIQGIENGEHELVASDSLTLEIDRTPDRERRARVRNTLRLARAVHSVTLADLRRAATLIGRGFGTLDALNLACAEALEADAFLTTDDALIRRARRLADELNVRVLNPVEWIAEGLQ